MANLRTLRRKLEAEIKALQDKLRALELVEQELGQGRTRQPRTGRPGTVTATTRQVVLGDRSRLWTLADVIGAVQADGAPNTTRANVSTALRRLAKNRVLEVVSGNRRVGLTYRVRSEE